MWYDEKTDTTCGLQLNTETGRIHLNQGEVSHFQLEFRPITSRGDQMGGPVRDNVPQWWVLHNPWKNQSYSLALGNPKSNMENWHYLCVRGSVQSLNIRREESGVEERMQKDFKYIQKIEEARKDAVKATEALREQRLKEDSIKAQDEAADAKHLVHILELRGKCFPNWENEKALKRRLVKVVNPSQKAKVEDEIEKQESALTAAVEIHFCWAKDLISRKAYEEIMKSNKVSRDIQIILDNNFEVFGLPNKVLEQPKTDAGRRAEMERLGKQLFPLPSLLWDLLN